ncbi:MAG: sulfatase [Verrucomicrobiota bacterium]
MPPLLRFRSGLDKAISFQLDRCSFHSFTELGSRHSNPMKIISHLFVLLLLTSAAAANDRMNVLFLAIDDLNTWVLSDPDRYTGKVIAPNIKKLASDGMLFTRAYCASSVCSPSRTAILSGVAPWKSGIYQNALENNDSPAIKAATPLPTYFRQNGYYTATSGKISHAYAMPGAWDRELPHTRDPRPPNPNKGYGPIHLDEAEMNDTKYADFAIEELGKAHDKPFFIACGMFHPHGPWFVPQKYFDLYPIEDIVLPEINEDDLNDVPEQAVRLASLDQMRQRLKGGFEERIQAYLASTTYADTQIGRVLDALAASPYAENTIVVLWSDHGYHMGEKMHSGKTTLWEEGTHSLLMFKAPGITEPGERCNRFVSLLDLYPTLVDLCDLPRPSHIDGNPLAPLLMDPDLPWNQPVITGLLEKWKSDVYLSVRTDGYRYINYGDGIEELYDCQKDPKEWTNQADNPEYREILEKHRAMLPEAVEAMPYVPANKRG